MAFQSVPYFVDGGAEHYASIMRTLSYATFGGQEGVLEAKDMAVSQLSTPGAGVQITKGVANILNRAPGGFSQSYIARNPGPGGGTTTVDITPTGSSGGRSDLIVARIEDPEDGSGLWSPPSDRTTGPYVFLRVIEGVPAGTKSLTELTSIGPWSAVPLARIDMPASTATVIDSYITDLRQVVNPATGLGPAPGGPGAEKLWTEESHTTVRNIVKHDQRTYINWPQEANWTVNIPTWATAVDIFAVVMNAQLNAGDVWGDMYLDIAGQGGTPTGFDMNWTGNPARYPAFVSGTQAIPASARGTAANIKLMAKMYNDSRVAGYLQADTSTYTHIQLNFKQTPVYV